MRQRIKQSMFYIILLIISALITFFAVMKMSGCGASKTVEPQMAEMVAGVVQYWEPEEGVVIPGPLDSESLKVGDVYRFDDVTGQLHWIGNDGDMAVLKCSRADITLDGELDVFDFIAFQDGMVLETWWSNFRPDDPTVIHDVFDFLAFQDEFVLGKQWTGGVVDLREVQEWERIHDGRANLP